MKLFALALIVAVVSAQSLNGLNLNAPALDDEMIAKINGINGHPWTAARNSFFEGKTIGDVVRMLGDVNDKMPEGVAAPAASKLTIGDAPAEFDGRTDNAWNGCVHPVRDQGSCGSCWAFSAAEGLSDRFCIASGGAVDVVMSPQDLVSCDTNNAGCNGGSGPSSASYLVNYGIVSDDCYNYMAVSGSCPSFDSCPDSDEEPIKYKGSDYNQLPNDEAAIREEYYANGPCYVRFDVFSDFMSYAGGVYVHTTGGRLGGHAVHTVGWGTDADSGLDYWLIANSWGTNWGIEGGHFKIARGQNECGIDAGVVCTVPDV